AARRAVDLLAALERLPVADAREVRHPRLPPARLLLHLRLAVRRDRACARRDVYDPPPARPPADRGHGRPRRPALDLGPPVHAVRDALRHGVEPRTEVVKPS